MERYTEYHAGIAVIKDKNKMGMAMMKLANYEDTEEYKAAAEKDRPSLPVLTNNEKRKEFLKGYKGWRVWIKVPEAGETYYRYNLPDGSGIVAKEYKYWASWKEKYSDEDPDSIMVDWYLLKPGYKYLHDCKTSDGAVVDHLRSAKKRMDEGLWKVVRVKNTDEAKV